MVSVSYDIDVLFYQLSVNVYEFIPFMIES